MTTLQKNIKKLFLASKLTQEEFAVRHGGSQKTLWTYINGKSEPNYLFILSLCKYYNISSEFLIHTNIRVDDAGNIANRPIDHKKLQELKNKMDYLTNEYRDQMQKVIKEMFWIAQTPR